MLQSRTVNNTNLIIWVLGTFVVYERNFPYVIFLPLWRKIMCSLLESNLCFSQRINPFNCSMLQIIFINVDFKAFFVIFTLLYFCWFYTEFPVAQTGLKIATLPGLTLKFWSSCLHTLSVAMNHHVRSMKELRIKSRALYMLSKYSTTWVISPAILKWVSLCI